MIYIYYNWLCKLSNLKFVIICTVWDQQGKRNQLIIINVNFQIFFISVLRLYDVMFQFQREEKYNLPCQSGSCVVRHLIKQHSRTGGVAVRRDEPSESSVSPAVLFFRPGRTQRPETFQPGLERAQPTEAQIRGSEGASFFFFSSPETLEFIWPVSLKAVCP